MPRTRKPRTPDPDPTASDPSPSPPAADDEGAESRPSQLEQIRAALAQPAASAEEVPELPAPESVTAPELEAHAEPPAAEEPPPANGSASKPAGPIVTPAPPPTSMWVPPPTAPPPPPRSTSRSAGPSSAGLALGIVLVVVGAFFLVMRVLDVDLSSYGWPLYVIIPGLTLLVVGFVSLGTGAVVPGGIITMTGLVLAYQNATGDWASWSYAWALVLPGGVGLGLFLQGMRHRDPRMLKQGRSLVLWAVLIFMIGFVFFESILNISGIDYGVIGRAALPVLLIVIGLMLLVRGMRRNRAASATGSPPAS
jgi:hypothetical protein